MDNIVSMKNIEKYFGDFHALKDINFEVKQGEIVGSFQKTVGNQ